MLTIIPTTDGRASIFEPELSEVSLQDILACQSKQFAVAGLSVSFYDLPARGCAVHQEDRYFFIYRPQGRNGSNLLMPPRPEYGRHQLNDSRCLMVAPNARIRVEWTSAAGSLVKFGFCPQFFKRMANCLRDFSDEILRRLETVSFLLDRRLDALCRLLMEEAENNCQSGSLYLEALARELAMGVLTRVHNQAQTDLHVRKINPSILRSVLQIEECFANRVCIQEMAAQAGMSPRHFTRCFLHATGHTPHDYLLLVRLNRARHLMTRSGARVCLKEIAGLCGFCDQAHLTRHFRRIFGATPAEFVRAHERSHYQSIAGAGDGRNVLNFVRNVSGDAVDLTIDVA